MQCDEIVIDLQDFNSPEFVPKDLTVLSTSGMGYYLFKPLFPFRNLTNRQVTWLENNHHQLK